MPVMLGTRPTEMLLSKFTVSDLPRSYAFYTEVIGLRHATSPGIEVRPPTYADMEEHPFVEAPLNFTGSLADPFFVVVHQRGLAPSPQTTALSWVGFKVQDARAIVERVRKAGFEVVREPWTVQGSNVTAAVVRDPDGYSVEFIELT